MEHAPGAIHADGVVQSLPEGSITETAETYLARGAVGIMYFQWRASRGGAEQWHPAMIPHESPEGPVFDEVTRLGAALATRTPKVVNADVALVYDEQTVWAWQGEHLPTRHLDYEHLTVRWHTALTEAHGTVDVIPPGAHLDRYRLVVAPALYLMSATTHTWLRSSPGDIILTAASGAIDEHARVTPASLDDLIGARITARRWLPPGESIPLTHGRTAGLCFETLQPTTARVLLTTTDGSPTVIRNNRVTYIAALDLVEPAQ